MPGRITINRHKYNAKPTTTADGIRFDSKKEAKVWGELRFEQQVGLITGLTRQVEFECVVNGVSICKYRCDFVYTRAGKVHYVDAKGVATPVYRLKKKLMLACHGISLEEV